MWSSSGSKAAQWGRRTWRYGLPSYFHGHSGVSRASSRHSGAGTGYVRATDPDTVLPAYSRNRAVRFSRAVASRRTGPRVPMAGSGQRSVVMRPRRLTGTPRRPPIG
jgi:hypothetical protein